MNDIKTLYDACSDKDELAQIAEKLGIEKGGLPQILNEILNAIEQGTGLGIIDVTEDLASGDITYERYEQLANASFVKYEGLIYVAGQFIPGLDLPDNASEIKFFTNFTLYRSDGTVNSTYCIVAYVLGTTWRIETKEI